MGLVSVQSPVLIIRSFAGLTRSLIATNWGDSSDESRVTVGAKCYSMKSSILEKAWASRAL